MPDAEGTPTTTESAQASRANVAAALAALAVAIWIVLIAIDADGPIWILVGVASLGAVITGLRAGGGALPRGRALAALVVGAALFTAFVVFTILEA